MSFLRNLTASLFEAKTKAFVDPASFYGYHLSKTFSQVPYLMKVSKNEIEIKLPSEEIARTASSEINNFNLKKECNLVCRSMARWYYPFLSASTGCMSIYMNSKVINGALDLHIRPIDSIFLLSSIVLWMYLSESWKRRCSERLNYKDVSSLDLGYNLVPWKCRSEKNSILFQIPEEGEEWMKMYYTTMVYLCDNGKT